jgi:hypothetical protein
VKKIILFQELEGLKYNFSIFLLYFKKNKISAQKNNLLLNKKG